MLFKKIFSAIKALKSVGGNKSTRFMATFVPLRISVSTTPQARRLKDNNRRLCPTPDPVH